MGTSRFDRIPKVVAGRKLSRRRAIAQGGGAIVTGALGINLGRRIGSPGATPQVSLAPDLADVMPLSLSGDRLATFRHYVATRLAELRIPGASVAVVQGDEVVFLNGYGMRALNRTEPVTPDTLLRIGSVTKSFSSLLWPRSSTPDG